MRVASSCLAAALIVGLATAPAAAADADAAPVRLNVGLVDSADATAVLGLLGDQVLSSKPVDGLPALSVEVPAGAADASINTLTQHPTLVRYAEADGIVHADSDPHEGSNKTAYQYDRITGAKSWGNGTPGVTVAVVDSGVTVTPELPEGRLTAGRDVVDGDADPADDDDHGTMVATLIAGEADNGIGASGICSLCSVMPVRVLRHRDGGPAEGTSADLASGIVWAADHGAQVINLSLSTATPSRLLEDAVRHASAEGSLVVAAAGNSSGTAREYPAAIEPALAVSTVRQGYTASSKVNSATDRWIDLAADDIIYTMDRAGKNRFLYATSASAAVVSGVAALGFSVRSGNTAGAVRTALTQTAASSSRATTGWDPRIIDASGALRRLGVVDTVAPVVTSTGLTPGETLDRGGRAISPTVSDDHAVQRIEEIVNGQVVVTKDQPWESMWAEAPHGTRGDMVVTIRAYDYASNYSDASTTVVADARAPTADIVSPAPGTHVRGGPVQVVVRVPGTSSPVSSVASLTDEFEQVPGTDDWTGTAVPSASGFFQVTVTGTNHISTIRTTTLTIDASAPTASSLSPAYHAHVRGTFTASINGVTDGTGPVKAQLWANGKDVGTDTSAPYSLKVATGSSQGNVNLTWKLFDALGNASTYSRQVIADNQAPTLSITKAPANKAKVTGTVKVYVKASDASGINRVELLVNGKVVAKDTTSGYVLSFAVAKQKKTMKVQVRAYDELGIAKYTSFRTWTRK